jgi:acyl-CoA synthetase (AMP-forming)/AMP-acid ligase II
MSSPKDHELSISERLVCWAGWAPSAPALRGVDGYELSRIELWNAVAAIANRLAAIGVRREDRVALLLQPGIAAAVALLGTMAAAAAVPLDPKSTRDERSRDLRRLRPRIIVADSAHAAQSEADAAELGVIAVHVDELVTPRGPRKASDPEAAMSHGDSESIAVILHTSGTTDLPKRVPLPQRTFIAGADAARERLGLTPDDVLLLTAGLHTISGPGNLLTALLSGGSCVVAPGFDPVGIRKWFVDHQPTWMVTTAAELNLMLDAADASGVEAAGMGSRMRLVMVGGQPMTPGTAERTERSLRATILERYGMTEATYIAWSGADETERRPGSCGRPLAATVRILDDAGEDLGPGLAGEIVIRGPTLFPGYLDDPGANAAVFLPGGWFRTGDVGYRDEDGFLFLSGRIKEQINRGGEKIAPVEIDHVLASHPAVAEAAVFAAPDRRLGEDIVAAVVLAPGQNATQRELRAWMLDRLRPSRVPRRIWVVDALPRTPTGKVRRGELVSRWEATHQ